MDKLYEGCLKALPLYLQPTFHPFFFSPTPPQHGLDKKYPSAYPMSVLKPSSPAHLNMLSGKPLSLTPPPHPPHYDPINLYLSRNPSSPKPLPNLHLVSSIGTGLVGPPHVSYPPPPIHLPPPCSTLGPQFGLTKQYLAFAIPPVLLPSPQHNPSFVRATSLSDKQTFLCQGSCQICYGSTVS